MAFLCVGKGSFDVFGVFTIHGDVSALGSLELFRFAEIVMILFGCASYHFTTLGDFDFLYDGFSSFLLHRVSSKWSIMNGEFCVRL